MSMPASAVVQVNSTLQQSVVPEVASQNQILLLTNESPLSGTNASPYKVYSSSTAVENDYGSNSQTFLMAQTMFNQKSQPNFTTTPNGALIIAPMLSAVSATYSQFITSQILGPNITAFQGVSNGAMDIVVDGITYQLRNLNFTGITTATDILSVIQNSQGVPNLNQYCNSSLPSPGVDVPLNFFSKIPGSPGTIALASPSPLPVGAVDITGVSYLDIASGAGVLGVNSSGETLSEAVTRLTQLPNPPIFGAVITNLIVEQTAALAFASFVQSGLQGQPLEWSYTWGSIHDCDPIEGTCSKIVTLGYSQTRMCMDFVNPIYLMSAAYNARLRAVNIDQPGSFVNGMPNLNKNLDGLFPNVVDVDLYNNKIRPSGVDMYLNVAGEFGIALPSGENGGFFNTIYFFDSINLRLQNDIVALLASNTTTASPSGDSLLSGSVRSTLIKISQCGMTVPGIWNTAIPSGVPNDVDFAKQIERYGFYVYVAPYTTRTPQDIIEGKTPPIIVAVNLIGGINKVVINLTAQQS